MRQKKLKSPLMSFVVFIALGALSLTAFAQPRRDAASLNRLREKAWQGEKVQVIVRFAVPDIEQLTAASTQFWGLDETPEAAKERMLADTNLALAIEYSSWKVLTELQGTDFEVLARFDYIPAIALRVSADALAVLENSPDVLGVFENTARKLIDPVKGNVAGAEKEIPDEEDMIQPMLNDTAELVGAEDVWSQGYTGAGWYVAILDTGIRKTHQFFSGKTVVEACRASGQDGNPGAGDCPNGQAVQNGPGSAVHYPSSYDGYDHGTHVAGIAAGRYGSLAGIAKGANIIAVKIFSKFNASACGGSPCVLRPGIRTSWPV